MEFIVVRERGRSERDLMLPLLVICKQYVIAVMYLN